MSRNIWRPLGTQPLESERLILRRFSMDDAQVMFESWASDVVATKYMSFNPHKNIDETKNILNLWIELYSRTDFFNWAIVLKENQELIGSIGADVDDDKDNVSTGYVVAQKYWGHGYATESHRLICNYLFNDVGMDELWCICNKENIMSIRVMEKTGFIFSHEKRKVIRDNEVTLSIYHLKKEEFKQLKNYNGRK